jgi:hypothetical protein
MFGAMTGSKGQVVAVLQLANKSEITPDDERKLINLAGLIGVCIDGTLEVMESMSLVIKLKANLEGLAKMIGQLDQIGADSDSNKVGNYLQGVKSMLSAW